MYSMFTGREECKLSSSQNYPAQRPTSLELDSSGSFPLTLDTEALIKIELDIITPQCPTNSSTTDTLHIANIQFNNLDFVGELCLGQSQFNHNRVCVVQRLEWYKMELIFS